MTDNDKRQPQYDLLHLQIQQSQHSLAFIFEFFTCVDRSYGFYLFVKEHSPKTIQLGWVSRLREHDFVKYGYVEIHEFATFHQFVKMKNSREQIFHFYKLMKEKKEFR